MVQMLTQQITAKTIATALPGCRRIRHNEYKACCPAHDDNSPSLSITQKSGSVLVYCWSGCSQTDVIDALRSMGLWHSNGNKSQNGLTQDQREYMRLWCLTYRDNAAKGYQPSPDEQNKNRRYSRALELCNGR